MLLYNENNREKNDFGIEDRIPLQTRNQKEIILVEIGCVNKVNAFVLISTKGKLVCNLCQKSSFS